MNKEHPRSRPSSLEGFSKREADSSYAPESAFVRGNGLDSSDRRLEDSNILLDGTAAYGNAGDHLTLDVPADPPGLGPRITYSSHAEGAAEMAGFFPGLETRQLRDGEGWAVEQVALTTHAGTHLDAPWHFASTMNRGERAWTIDEVPLDWCIRPGVKLDLRHLPDGDVATAAEIQAELDRIGHRLRPFDIVLVNTAAGSAFGRPDYIGRGCGVGREATLWLLSQGVHITGTDAWSWDAPFSFTRARFAETGDASIIWEGHKAGREGIFLHLEKLTRLEELPPTGFTVSCLPVKLKGGSAGWCRAIAMLD